MQKIHEISYWCVLGTFSLSIKQSPTVHGESISSIQSYSPISIFYIRNLNQFLYDNKAESISDIHRWYFIICFIIQSKFQSIRYLSLLIFRFVWKQQSVYYIIVWSDLYSIIIVWSDRKQQKVIKINIRNFNMR